MKIFDYIPTSLKVISSIVKEIEKNKKDVPSMTKLEMAIQAAKLTLIDGLKLPITEVEIKDIIEGVVASYNVTGRFLHKK